MPKYFSADKGNARELLRKSGFLGLRAAVYEEREVEAMLHPARDLLSFLPDVQLMIEPSPQVVERLLKIGGFHYSPVWITWEQPVAPFAEHLARRHARLGKEESQAKKQLYNYSHSIEKSKRLGIEASFVPLSSSAWLEFYDGLYLPWVVKDKDAGVDGAGRDFPAPEGGSGGDTSRFNLLFLRDSRDGNRLVGGALLEDFEIKGTLRIKFAASDKSDKYKSLSLSYRAYDETVGFATSRGFSTLSYGTEPNFYAPEGQADMITFGLNSFKAKLCFEPLLLDLPGYNKKRVFRLLSDKWTRQTSCFFYRFKSASSNVLEAAISGDRASQVSFPASTEQVDVTSEVRGTHLAEIPIRSSNPFNPIYRFFKKQGR
jgi:hypothetical protein